MTDADLSASLHHDLYPRSNHFDAEWIIANQMGPHPLWLMESLVQALHIDTSMRALDLGCGRAITLVFLAREFGAQIWATDLWIDPSDNLVRIRQAGVADRVFPIHAEAHDLPYADGFFDVIVSVDAYQYFGTDDTLRRSPACCAPVAASESWCLRCSASSARRRRRRWPTCGSGTDCRSTDRTRGERTGRSRAPSRSRPPTPYPTAGGTGCAGPRSQVPGPTPSGRPRRRRTKRRCCASTAAS